MCRTSAGVKTTDFENSINLMFVYRNDSFQTNIGRMTIDAVFMAKNKVVLRINMSVTNFYCKILRELTTEELKKWIPTFSDGCSEKTYTDKEFIRKVWCICVHYMELDTMKFVL